MGRVQDLSHSNGKTGPNIREKQTAITNKRLMTQAWVNASSAPLLTPSSPHSAPRRQGVEHELPDPKLNK